MDNWTSEIPTGLGLYWMSYKRKQDNSFYEPELIELVSPNQFINPYNGCPDEFHKTIYDYRFISVPRPSIPPSTTKE